MSNTTRISIAAALLASLLIPGTAAPLAQTAASPQLFRIVGPRDEVTIGVTTAELDAMGAGPAVDRLARTLVANGHVTAWQYVVGRGPDGATRYNPARRIAILRADSLRIEPTTAALPVSPPPAQ